MTTKDKLLATIKLSNPSAANLLPGDFIISLPNIVVNDINNTEIIRMILKS